MRPISCQSLPPHFLFPIQYLLTCASVVPESQAVSCVVLSVGCDEAVCCGSADRVVAATPPAAPNWQRRHGGTATATVATANAAAAAAAIAAPAPPPAPVHGEYRQRRRLGAAHECGSNASAAHASSLTLSCSLCAHEPAARVFAAQVIPFSDVPLLRLWGTVHTSSLMRGFLS